MIYEGVIESWNANFVEIKKEKLLAEDSGISDITLCRFIDNE